MVQNDQYIPSHIHVLYMFVSTLLGLHAALFKGTFRALHILFLCSTCMDDVSQVDKHKNTEIILWSKKKFVTCSALPRNMCALGVMVHVFPHVVVIIAGT